MRFINEGLGTLVLKKWDSLSDDRSVRDLDRGPNLLEIPGTNGHPDLFSFQIRHQLLQAGLRLLYQHSCGLDGADLGHGVVLLRGREGVNVLKDVCFGRDREGLSASRAKG